MAKVTIDADLADLIPGYLENRTKDVTALKNLLAENNFEEIRGLAHKMKGSGGGYGFDQISEIGRIMETAAKENNAGQIKSCIDELADYLENIEITYSE